MSPFLRRFHLLNSADPLIFEGVDLPNFFPKIDPPDRYGPVTKNHHIPPKTGGSAVLNPLKNNAFLGLLTP